VRNVSVEVRSEKCGCRQFTNRRSALHASNFALGTFCFVAFWVLLLVTTGSGYRLAGKATAIPPNIDSVILSRFPASIIRQPNTA